MRKRQSAPLRTQLAPVTLLILSGLLVVSCGELQAGDGDGDGDGDGPVTDRTVAEVGLDAPPVPVGAFLDGAFPTRTPNEASSTTWDLVEAFPGVSFNQTLAIVPNPSDNRLYVGSRDGNIFSMENTPSVSTTEPFMDIRDRVAAVWDGGFLGLAFHPDFGTPGSANETTFYTYYSSYCPTVWDGQEYVNDFGNCNPTYPQTSTGGFFNTWLRASRFQAVRDAQTGLWTGDPNSEKPLFNIRLYNGSHRGGGPIFGIDEQSSSYDGYMYVIIGDQFRYETAQDITDNFEGGSIRIVVDVTINADGTWDCPNGTHQPVRRLQDLPPQNPDEMTGQYYCIPDDNPWAAESGDVFDEFYSIGHRNPHRISVDTENGRIWSGEVGQSSREEINVILRGRNYQWPYMEGLNTGVRQPPSTIRGIEQPPVIDFIRSEAKTIIGGYVYRGTKFPELYGKYIAGDYSTDNIWAFTLNETTMTATKEFLTLFGPGGLATFGQDNDGEIYLGDVFGDDSLYALDRIGGPAPEPPSTLSALGAFTDTASFALKDYWVPYDLNLPFWSDGAWKLRWIALANDGTRDTAEEQIAYSENGLWNYPVGTVLMKHFELALDENDTSVRTKLETRFLVLGDDFRWYGVTYRWRADQLDADLLNTFETQDYTITLEGGGTRNQTWHFPSRQECMACHLEVSGGALGLNTRQQNGDFFYPSTGRSDNQLVTWNHLDMFSPPIDEATLPALLTSVQFSDVTASLEDRARSWLDSNCGYCHQPGGANAGFDARLTTPFENQGMVYGGVRNNLGEPAMAILTPGDPNLSAMYRRAGTVGPIGMPPLAKALAQDPAVEILGEWIRRVDPNLGQNGIDYEYYETGDISALPDFDSFTPDATGTVSTFDIGVRNQDDYFAFRFTSLLQITTAGDYTFFTSSDDGSQLFIGGQLVVDNDGLHGVQEQSGIVTLAAGYHPIMVTMFERTGSQALTVNYQGPDTSNNKEEIGTGRLFLQQPTIDNDPPDLTNPGPLQSSVGETVSVTLQATDPNGDFLYFDAAGLPPGLTLDHTTGEIAGTVLAVALGSHDMTASASDQNLVSVQSTTWDVVAPPGGCGDGNQDAGEECDDGNLTSGDGCTSSCALEYCGDGIVNNGGVEECDPPNTAVCSSTCTIVPGGTSCTVHADCDDGDVCTDDQCDPVSNSCLHDYLAATCDDQNACTDVDICAEGVCVGGNLATGCTSCQGVADIPAAGGTFFGAIAGTSYLGGSCGSTQNTAERVYRWVPEASGAVTVETCGPETDYDTAMFVRSDDCDTGAEVDCSDDFEGCAVNSGLSNAARHGSRVQFTAEAGREYYIVVSGYNGRVGNYKLTVTSANTTCGNDVVDPGEECDGTDAAACATGQCDFDCSCVTGSTGPDLVSEIEDVGFEFNTNVPAEDVAEGCATATSGIDIIRFATWSHNFGNADMVLGDPACPDCTAAPDAPCGNPNFVCAPAGGHGHAHYENFARFDLVDSVTRAVVASTHKRGFCLRDSACSTGSATYGCGFQGISAGCSDLYRRSLGCQFIEITGVPDGNYELQVTVDPFGLLPEINESNNTSVMPVAINRGGGGGPGGDPDDTLNPLGEVYSGVTSGVSNYAGSCSTSATAAAPEHVLELTAAASGTYTVQTCSQNTLFDTVMYAREGSTTGPYIGCNDDTGGCGVNDGTGNADRHGSVVSIDAIAGQTYYIFVDGYVAEGAYELTVTRPDGGYCGDGTTESLEVCDGADDAACPGQCQADCSCPSPTNVCGDDVAGGTEMCDGSDDAACPGLCQSDCTCGSIGPVCGDGVRDGTEACDGSDAVACPGMCMPDCACAPVTATTNTLVAAKDSTLFQSALGDLSNGAGDYLFAGQTAVSTSRRALVAFDVAGGVPAGSIIHGAELILTMSRTVAQSTPVGAHRMSGDWGESSSHANGEEGGGAAPADGDVTWLYTHYDAVTPEGSRAWTNPGGDFVATASARTSVAGIGSYSWHSPELTADVQAWLGDPAGNFGWVMIGGEGSEPTAKRFDSRENVAADNWPRLLVYFSPPSSSWGACCDDTTGACGFALDAIDCATQGGTYQGDSTVCSPNPCPPPPDVCGDGFLGATEECDVGEDAACPGRCQSDCTCAPPPVCGNDTHETEEQCDGTDDAACPGRCQGDCTCPPPPVCGNDVLEGTEECDGTDDAACPGRCQGDCACAPIPVCGNNTQESGEECDGTDASACLTGQCYSAGSSAGPECTCVPPVTDIPSSGGIVTGFTSGTSAYSGSCGSGSVNAPEQVLTWVPDFTGEVTFDTCSLNTEFDTVLYVREGSPTAADINCNDDTSGCAVSSGSSRSDHHGSQITVDVTAGQTYYVIVDGYRPSSGAEEGAFELSAIPTGATFLPDLTPSVSDFVLDFGTSVSAADLAEGCASAASGVDLLRFTGTTSNVGAGDLFLGDPGCPDCVQNPLAACTASNYTCASGDGHGEYQNFVSYELLDATGQNVVAQGYRRGNCLRDDSCSSGSPTYDCSNQGLSAGCSDVYDNAQACQYVEITGLPPGDYLLRMTSDPLDLIQEDNEANNVTVVPVAIPPASNIPPTALPDSATTDEDNPVAVDVLANDTDQDGFLVPSSVAVIVAAGNGVTSVNPATGMITYTPSANFFGQDTFSYQVLDDVGSADAALVTVTVNGVNDPPTAADDNETTLVDTAVVVDVLSNDSDPEGGLDPTSVAITSAPSNGSYFVDSVTGAITYTPNAGVEGVDQLTYQVSDIEGLLDTAVVTIAVTSLPAGTTPIPASGGVIAGFTSGASNYGGTCAGASADAPDQVFVWVPDTTGTATIETCSLNTEFDTVLYIREGSSTGNEIGCDDDTSGCAVNSGSSNSGRHGSQISIDVTAGQTYHIIVDGYRPSSGADEGNFELTVTPAGP